MLTMVAIALIVIGVASTVALRSHLLDRSDSQLTNTAHSINLASLLQLPKASLVLPTDYMVGVGDGEGGWTPVFYDRRLEADDLPTCEHRQRSDQ